MYFLSYFSRNNIKYNKKSCFHNVLQVNRFNRHIEKLAWQVIVDANMKQFIPHILVVEVSQQLYADELRCSLLVPIPDRKSEVLRARHSYQHFQGLRTVAATVNSAAGWQTKTEDYNRMIMETWSWRLRQRWNC